MKEYTFTELLAYIKEHGITLVQTTKDFITDSRNTIPVGTKLYVGYNESVQGISSNNYYVGDKNKQFYYSF